MSGFEAFVAATSMAIDAAKTIASRNAQARQASAQAGYLQAQANNERRLAEIHESTLRRNQSREMARARALLAGRGIEVGSGSALLARQQAAADAEFDALLLRSTGAARVATADRRARVAANDATRERLNAAFDNGKTLFNFGNRLAGFGAPRGLLP